jgi:hypothetical protein
LPEPRLASPRNDAVAGFAIAGAAAATLAPIVVLAVRASRSSWVATADQALIELRTRAVGTSHTPLVGPYSRFGWNHPGPALFFALAAPYRMLSSQGKGLLLGAALIAGVAMITIVAVLLSVHQPRLVVLFGLLVTAVLVRALGPAFLWQPWNPYVIVLPFLALVLLSWRAAAGEARALPFAVGFASFVAQTHVSLAPEALALLAVASAWLLANARETGARRRLRRSALVSSAVLAVMWALPIVQQIRPRGGNLGKLVRFWTAGHHGTVGFAKATRLLAPQLSIPSPWMTGHEHSVPFSGALSASGLPFPYALAVLLAAAIVSWRRRDRMAMAACSVAVTVAIVAWISVARIVDTPYPYILRWTWVVGATCWLASGIALLPPIASRLGPRRETWLARALATGAGVLLVVVTVSAMSVAPPDERDGRVARDLVDQAIPRLRALSQPLLVETGQGGYRARSLLAGVIVNAVEHDIDARFPPTESWRAGSDRAVDPNRAGTRVFVAVADDVASYTRDPSYRRVAWYDSLSSSERREYERLSAAWGRALKDLQAGRLKAYIATHETTTRRLAELARREYTAAVFVRVSGP